MKNTRFFWGLTLLLACNSPQSSTSNTSSSSGSDSDMSITIKGSDTVLPVAEEAADLFMKKNPDANLKVVGGGSGVGIAALINNTTDIAMVSRDLNHQERNSLALMGKSTERIILAYDALAVIVHPENPINQITIKELELIFTGKVTNWKELGGPDLAISPYSRESSSGTYEYFKEVAMHDREYAPHVLKMPATDDIVKAVRQNREAIGYVGVAYLEEPIKALKILNKTTEDYIEPTLANARSNVYPIVRPLYYFFLQEDTERLKPLIDFILSEEGQQIIEEVGYVPL